MMDDLNDELDLSKLNDDELLEQMHEDRDDEIQNMMIV